MVENCPFDEMEMAYQLFQNKNQLLLDEESASIFASRELESFDEIEMAQQLFQNKNKLLLDEESASIFASDKLETYIAIHATCPCASDCTDWRLEGAQSLVLHIGDQAEITKVLLNSPLRFPFVGHLVDCTGALIYPQAATLFPTLHLAILDDQSMEQLTRLMPGMVHLQVVISHAPISVLTELASLLANWATTLQSLSVTIGDLTFSKLSLINSAFSTIVSNLRLLIQAINRKLRALQTLSLNIGRDLYLNYLELLEGGESRVPLRLSILGQLREFNLRLGDCPSAPSFLLKQLEAYATQKLTAIGLGGDFNWNWKEVVNSQFAERFTLVPFNNSLTPDHSLSLESFTNLTVYVFNWKQLHSLDLVIHLSVLSSLSNLQYLKMDFFSPVSHPIAPSYLKLPSLRSVTVLEISIDLKDNENHNHLHAFFWAILFPSVQIVKVTHCGYFCTICFQDAAKQKITNFVQVAPCLRQLLAPLRDLPSLRKIFYQRGSKSDWIVEFTPQGEFVHAHASNEYIG